MDRDTQRQLLPHYVAVVVLTVLALTVTRELSDGGWVNLLVVVVVVLTYPTVVRVLGVEPDAWGDDQTE